LGQEMQTLNDIAVKVGRLEVMQENNTRAISDMAISVNKLVDKLDKSDDVAKNAGTLALKANERLDKIEDNQKYLWRTVIGAVLIALVTFILKGGLTP